jgi:hypothetical protein
VPVGGHETPIDDVYAAYGSPSVALFALIILAGLIASVALLATFALKALRTRA